MVATKKDRDASERMRRRSEANRESVGDWGLLWIAAKDEEGGKIGQLPLDPKHQQATGKEHSNVTIRV